MDKNEVVEALCEAVELIDEFEPLEYQEVAEARDIVAAVVTELTCE